MIKNNKGFSSILAMLMTSFMLALVAGIFNLVSNEFRAGINIEKELKAYYTASSWIELWLLWIKEKGLWYKKEVSNMEVFWTSEKEADMSYMVDSQVSSYVEVLSWGQKYEIIPLFRVDDDWNITKNNNVSISGDPDIVWNIVWDNSGLSGVAWSSYWVEKTVDDYGDFNINTNKSISSFLNENDKNYLVLYNKWNWNSVYNVNSLSSETFSAPEFDIVSTGEIWNIKQTLKMRVDGSNSINLIKYSYFNN